MSFPSKEKSYVYLRFAKQRLLEQGSTTELTRAYEGHCINVSKAARLIAKEFADLDVDKAEILGLLHDVGKTRRECVCKRHHSVSGYEYMMEEGYPDVARICLTHTFPFKNFSGAMKDLMFDKEDDIKFVKEYLANTDFDLYDEIIQLADIMALEEGFVTIEKRFDDIVKRYANEDMRENQPLYNKLKEKLGSEIGKDIYEVLSIDS